MNKLRIGMLLFITTVVVHIYSVQSPINYIVQISNNSSEAITIVEKIYPGGEPYFNTLTLPAGEERSDIAIIIPFLQKNTTKPPLYVTTMLGRYSLYSLCMPRAYVCKFTLLLDGKDQSLDARSDGGNFIVTIDENGKMLLTKK